MSKILLRIKVIFGLVTMLVVLTAYVPHTGAAIRHVPGEYPNIQVGIDVAKDGETVLVADGIYTGEGNKNLDFRGKPITVQSENGPDHCIIDCAGEGRGFYFFRKEGKDSVLSGFTVQNGSADFGGGIYCKNSSPSISNCTITGNTANYGGGIACPDPSSPIITNCFISGNVASDNGGGIYCFSQFESSSYVIIKDCTITGNSVNYDKKTDKYSGGGGIYCENSSPSISDCTITGNSVNYGQNDSYSKSGGGGGICCENSSPSITDCTITGNAVNYDKRSNNASDGGGGGIFCENSSSNITNCIIRDNSVNTDDGEPGGGGGICCKKSSPNINNCTITMNKAPYGGGIACPYFCSPIKITNCTIFGNTATSGPGGGHGGGICSGNSLIIENSIISENNAAVGGGILCDRGAISITKCTVSGNKGGGLWCNDCSTCSIKNSTITGNSATEDLNSQGGGINCCSMGFHDSNSIIENYIIDNCIISGNSSGFGGGIWCDLPISIKNSTISENSASQDGGGIYCSHYSVPDITNCTISRNSASQNGGGIYCSDSSNPDIANSTISRNLAQNGGGIYCSYSSVPDITNCIITWNTASIYGGGIYCSDSSVPDITNCTISRNSASKNGGGIYCFLSSSSTPTIVNSILWNNTPEIYIDKDPYITSNTTIAAYLDVIYSDIQGGYNGEGNIDEDPLFVDPDTDDFHLRPDSPCINAGTNDGAPTTDRDDFLRPDGPGYDLGAYEFTCSRPGICDGLDNDFYDPGNENHCDGDLNEDDTITPADALIAFKCYLGSDACQGCADVNQDGDITPADALFIFKKYLGQH